MSFPSVTGKRENAGASVDAPPPKRLKSSDETVETAALGALSTSSSSSSSSMPVETPVALNLPQETITRMYAELCTLIIYSGSEEQAASLIANLTREQLSSQGILGYPPLHLAIAYNHLGLARLLIEKVKPEKYPTVDVEGRTALQAAVKCENSQIENMIKQRIQMPVLAIGCVQAVTQPDPARSINRLALSSLFERSVLKLIADYL